jgi:hypothetical protein
MRRVSRDDAANFLLVTRDLDLAFRCDGISEVVGARIRG